jgi:hypothetical protein
MTLLLLTATARKEKRISTVENANAKKLDKSMRLCEKKVDKHHLEYKGKTSLRPLPLSIGERGKKKASNPYGRDQKKDNPAVSGHEDSEGRLEGRRCLWT